MKKIRLTLYVIHITLTNKIIIRYNLKNISILLIMLKKIKKQKTLSISDSDRLLIISKFQNASIIFENNMIKRLFKKN